MKAEELRIGNWINDKDGKSGHDMRINAAGISALYDSQRHDNEDYSSWKPIPITEEWLLKFGFENHSPGLYRIKIHDHQSRYLETMISVGREFWNFAIVIEHKHKTDDTEVWIRGLRNVNELQNLFFSLTGKELVASI